ncbi:MAG: TIGR03087 family PEP-CTERM/XrtA system glycosyltransferase [Zavarzinella sp.]
MQPNRTKNVLLVTHRLPYPPDKGDRIRTYHLLRFLSQRASVWLAALADEKVTDEARDTLSGMCKQVIAVPHQHWKLPQGAWNALKGKSISEGYFFSKELQNAIKQLAQAVPFDMAIASASSIADYLNIPELSNALRVIDVMDVDSQKWEDYAAASSQPKKMVFQLEAKRTLKAEKKLASWADVVTLVSEGEAKLFRDRTTAKNVHCIANGVDLNYFHPTTEPTDHSCVFVGVMDYRPNVDAVCWFAKAAWPEIRHRVPKATFRIVGRNPAPAVVELQNIPGVEVTGSVPDVRPYLAKAVLAVAPLQIARGIQNKVLEAMAAGKPVIASPQALGGLSHHAQLPILRAENRDQWLQMVTELLNNPQKSAELGQQGREFVEIYHNWDLCLGPFEQMLLTPKSSAGQ